MALNHPESQYPASRDLAGGYPAICGQERSSGRTEKLSGCSAGASALPEDAGPAHLIALIVFAAIVSRISSSSCNLFPT